MRNPLIRLAWAWLVTFDGLFTAHARIALPARCGRIVIAGGYVYDTPIEMAATLPTTIAAVASQLRRSSASGRSQTVPTS